MLAAFIYTQVRRHNSFQVKVENTAINLPLLLPCDRGIAYDFFLILHPHAGGFSDATNIGGGQSSCGSPIHV